MNPRIEQRTLAKVFSDDGIEASDLDSTILVLLRGFHRERFCVRKNVLVDTDTMKKDLSPFKARISRGCEQRQISHKESILVAP